MITKYTEYIKESVELPVGADYFINSVKTICHLRILRGVRYVLKIQYELDDYELNDIEERTGKSVNIRIIDLYINDYIKNILKIDFKKYESNEKLFLYFGLKFEMYEDVVIHYDNDIIINEDHIYLSGSLTIREVLQDLKKIYNIDEYNNIEKFIDDNIDEIKNSEYFLRLLKYCNEETRQKYQYIIDAKNFDLL